MVYAPTRTGRRNSPRASVTWWKTCRRLVNGGDGDARQHAAGGAVAVPVNVFLPYEVLQGSILLPQSGALESMPLSSATP